MRTLTAALKLFADWGAGATSYQMIADEVGVTKAAIYHQFKTKDELIIAVAEMELAKLEESLVDADAEDGQIRGRDLLLSRVVDHAVQHRRAASTMLFDPAIARLLSSHERFTQWLERLSEILVGHNDGPDARVRLASVTVVLGGVVAHPFVADLDDDTLRELLLDVVHRLADPPTSSAKRASVRPKAVKGRPRI